MIRFQRLYGWLFALVLISYSAYALLDTFVIPRVYTVVETGTDAEESGDQTTLVTAALSTATRGQGGHRRHSMGTTADTSATDATSAATRTQAESPAATEAAEVTEADSATIELSTHRVYDTTIYVAEAALTDPSQLKTAFAQNSYGRNVTAATSVTAAANNAILAINGDNYGSREKGYVIRGGVLYREIAAPNQEDLVIYADGSMEIINEAEVTARELLDRGAREVFSFGPGLIENGEIIVDANDEVDRAMASNPRTALGILANGHYVLVVSDGRTTESRGLSLYELAEFLRELGVVTAYNLDGGGSSTLVYQGQVVNHPTTNGRGSSERAVTDIIYIG